MPICNVFFSFSAVFAPYLRTPPPPYMSSLPADYLYPHTHDYYLRTLDPYLRRPVPSTLDPYLRTTCTSPYTWSLLADYLHHRTLDPYLQTSEVNRSLPGKDGRGKAAASRAGQINPLPLRQHQLFRSVYIITRENKGFDMCVCVWVRVYGMSVFWHVFLYVYEHISITDIYCMVPQIAMPFRTLDLHCTWCHAS